MRQYLEFYEPEKTYLYPNMQVATPEMIQASYSAVNVTKCVIGTDSSHTKFSSIDVFSEMKDRYDIDPELNDADALLALEEAINFVPEVSTEPAPEERIAAALEFQSILLIPDEVEV